MNKKILIETLDKFLTAWENKDIEDVVSLLADDFEYYESPLDEPLTNKSQIRELWQPVPRIEANISLDYKLLSITKAFGLFRITGHYSTEDDTKLKLIDRIFLLSVDEKGQIIKFMQWREDKRI